MKAGFFQFNPAFGQIRKNVEFILTSLEGAAFDLLVLPELFSTGYQFITPDEVATLSEPVPEGPTTTMLSDFSKKKSCYLVFGLAEENSGKYYNSAVITGPEGFLGVYRKAHLFYEEKIWFTPGDTGFRVWETDFGKIGIMICFDWFFPESARVLSLRGAEIIAHPSNLVLPYCPDAMPVRCLENSVYAITANRTGEESRLPEQSCLFIGMSQITGPDGKILARASGSETGITVRELDPGRARSKQLNHLNDVFRDRRPDLYHVLTSDRISNDPDGD
ncbi:MAG: nitrilase-related carbon-nitrogen hydrolase [bacterium]